MEISLVMTKERHSQYTSQSDQKWGEFI